MANVVYGTGRDLCGYSVFRNLVWGTLRPCLFVTQWTIFPAGGSSLGRSERNLVESCSPDFTADFPAPCYNSTPPTPLKDRRTHFGAVISPNANTASLRPCGPWLAGNLHGDYASCIANLSHHSPSHSWNILLCPFSFRALSTPSDPR